MTLAARSLLFIPADRERFYDKVAQLAPDAVIVDLEDAVLPEAREMARLTARARLPGIPRPAWVRVNAVGTADLALDLRAIMGVEGLAGIVVPKVDGPDDVAALDVLLAEAEARAGSPSGGTAVIPMIESARGVITAFAIATASGRIASVSFGGARGGDLHGDLGSAWSIDGPELLHARQAVLLAARAARLAWPLDGVYADVGDAAGFERDTELSRRLGYRGRPVIHPSQVGPANSGYAPTPDEVEAARAVVEAARTAAGRGEGVTLVGGRLVDAAMVRQAQAVLELDTRLTAGSRTPGEASI